MKNVVFYLILYFVPLNVYGQSWTFKKGGDVFDGSYRTSSVQGIGYEFPYTKPLFVLNVFNGDASSPNIYITNVPYAGCSNSRILIKFDNDEKTYRPIVSSSNNKEQWFMEFSSDYKVVRDSMKKIIKYYIVSENQKVKLRKEPVAGSLLVYEAQAKDTIQLLIFDGVFWTCRYNNQILYVHDMFITNIDKAVNSKEEIYVPMDRQVKTDKELKEFISDLKSHTKMNIRLLSDCVKSDFTFSLTGSTAALNFVFSK
jgi:hypothetical protein